MRKLLVVVLGLCLASVGLAHLCNDVFQQAKDNLAVKVDIRDGQLRIGKEASFRVYVLNTMDRGIADLALDVRSEHFESDVKPSPDWRGYPGLKAVKEGGKKEYFTVMLRRKPGVPDGRYKIDLDLCSKQKKQSFKTVDFESAAALFPLAKAAAVKIDGVAQPTEWAQGSTCTDFQSTQKVGQFMENRPARDQTRFRLMYDKDNLYCLVSLAGAEEATADEAVLYVAPSTDSTPVKVTFDRNMGVARCGNGEEGLECKATPKRDTFECKIPRALLGIDKSSVFHMNFTRTVTRGNRREVSYWRGSPESVADPISFGQFRVVQ